MSPGVGVMASGKRVGGGGGGSVTIEEIITPANIANSSSGSIPITTNLQSGDLVMFCLSRGATSTTTVTFDGSAATLYGQWQNGSSGTFLRVYTATGLTGTGHNVGYTTGAGSLVNRFTIYVVRGLASAAVTADIFSAWDNTQNSTESTSTLAVGADKVVVAVGVHTSGATITFPDSQLPASGWTTDRAADTSAVGTSAVAHRIFNSADTAQMGIGRTSSNVISCAMFVLG